MLGVSRRGTIQVEYAIMLMLVAVAALAVLLATGQGVAHSFSGTARPAPPRSQPDGYDPGDTEPDPGEARPDKKNNRGKSRGRGPASHTDNPGRGRRGGRVPDHPSD